LINGGDIIRGKDNGVVRHRIVNQRRTVGGSEYRRINSVDIQAEGPRESYVLHRRVRVQNADIISAGLERRDGASVNRQTIAQRRNCFYIVKRIGRRWIAEAYK